MKKFIVIVALLVYPLSLLLAHPASDIKADYKAKTMILSIDVKHMVLTSRITDTKIHYIKEIVVSVNGVKAETKIFTSQTGDDVKASFKLKAMKGDTINITATCSIAGVKSQDITVQ